MTDEMPRDNTLAKLREPVITRLDVLKVFNDKLLRGEHDTINIRLEGSNFVVTFTQDEVDIGLAFLRLSKQL